MYYLNINNTCCDFFLKSMTVHENMHFMLPSISNDNPNNLNVYSLEDIHLHFLASPPFPLPSG